MLLIEIKLKVAQKKAFLIHALFSGRVIVFPNVVVTSDHTHLDLEGRGHINNFLNIKLTGFCFRAPRDGRAALLSHKSCASLVR